MSALHFPGLGRIGYFPTIASIAAICLVVVGCNFVQKEIALPGSMIIERDQLVIHSDFHIPKKHRLIDELTARRGDIANQLKLPLSDEPINVFVFENEDEFQQFMKREHPKFPNRRAFFVKNDTTLKVYAYWGEQVGEDLRHEVTHGYLHSVVPNLPLWLDEGLAEFYETSRGSHGVNTTHVFQLGEAFRRGDWQPSLKALEKMTDPAKMTQMQYAESWLWVHFLLEGKQGEPKLLQDQLARLRMSAESKPISGFVDKEIAEPELKLLDHLKGLVEDL